MQLPELGRHKLSGTEVDKSQMLGKFESLGNRKGRDKEFSRGT